MLDTRRRAVVVSANLPAIWHLQAVLLREGLYPRAAHLSDLSALSGEQADVVVLDHTVAGADALRVLSLVKPPPGVDVAPVLYITADNAIPPGHPGPRERYLPESAGDDAVRSEVGALLATIPEPRATVVPLLDEIDVPAAAEPSPVVAMSRRRRGASMLGPALGLVSILAVYVAYIGVFAGRGSSSLGGTPTPAVIVAAQTAVATEPQPVATEAPVALAAAAPAPTNATSSPAPVVQATATGVVETQPSPSPTLSPTVAVETGIQGRVTDGSSGAPIPGARVTIAGPSTAEARSDGDGSYQVTGLEPGAYRVSVAAPGYAEASNQTGVVTGVVSTDNLILSPGDSGVSPALTAVDTVTGESVAVRTYVVRPGDTLNAIAEAADTTLGAIRAVNPQLDPDNLTIGQVINLPASTFGEK